MYIEDLNSNEEKLVRLFVEIVRPDLTPKMVLAAMANSNIDKNDAIEWISEQVEAKEDVDGGINL